MRFDITIGLHKRFALIWCNEAGILTIQLGWLIAEIERLPDYASPPAIDLEPARAPIDLEPATSAVSPPAIDLEPARAPIDLEQARPRHRPQPIDLEPATSAATNNRPGARPRLLAGSSACGASPREASDLEPASPPALQVAAG